MVKRGQGHKEMKVHIWDGKKGQSHQEMKVIYMEW